MNAYMQKANSQHGLSLVEFMVAMLLGTILIGGAVTIYLASQRSYQETERAVVMGDGGRFAMMLLSDSLRHAGFMGGIRGTDVDDDTNLDTPTSDCSGDASAYDLDVFLLAATIDSSGAAFGCINDGRPGTEALVIKHFLPAPLLDADPNDPNDVPDGDISYPEETDAQTLYVFANGERGLLIDGAENDQPDVSEGEVLAGARAWPYQFQIFYIRNLVVGEDDGDDIMVPTLARKFLVWDSGAMDVVTQNLVEGVENMRFRFGFDSDNDGSVDSFGEIGDVTNWDTVAYVEPYILARSTEPDFNYTDEKTYFMAGSTVTPDPNELNFPRYLVSGGVTLRNPNLYLLGQL